MSPKIVLLVIPVLFFSFLGGYFVYGNIYKSKSAQTVNQSKSPSETANIPFKELTIPYLRDRNYKSQLGELTLYKKYSTYTSYLTSYDSDGLKINGLITVPNADLTKKHPAIVFVHGYIAPSVYNTTEKYVDYVDYLARNGYVVFKIDLRGHGDSQGEATGAYYSGDYIIDTINAYKALQSASFVNKEAVGLWGHSMAGNVTLRSAAAIINIPAVAIWAGAGFTYSDLLEFRINDNSYRPPQQNTQRSLKRQELRNLYGDFDPKSEFWKTVPATNYLNDFAGNIGLFHSTDDDVVSVEYSRNLKNILDSLGVKNEYNEYTSGGHNISGTNFTKAMQETVRFFDANLKNN